MFVKICGTTSEEDALLSVALGADALGFIFAPSKRQVGVERAADIIKRLPPDVLTVAVFRDETTERVLETVLKTGVKGVQLSGREGPEAIEAIRAKLPLFVIKGVSAASPSLARVQEFKADAVLVDAPSPGSGQVFDWRLAHNLPDGRTILAGGLHPGNVAEAIETVKPWGVDLATGVEASPGVKDPTKLREFISRAKAAGAKLGDRRVSSGDGPYDWREDWE